MSLACDYRVMTDGTKRNAWMCMNEIDFGAPWPVSFAAIVRAKVSTTAIRGFVVEGHRFTPPEARDVGLVDEIVVGGSRGVLKRAQEIAQEKAPKAREGVWGLIKVRLPFCEWSCTRMLTGYHFALQAEIYRPVVELVRLGIPTLSVARDQSAAQVRLGKL